ncbi:MAG TPA: radical SAM protein, partial [Candidatus Dormibacteraeota bacterium]|nr:radical SAM protein [Candidatus Dormibacteraeota bacterium]
YCLTESGPRVARRELDVERLPEIAAEARRAGFTDLGVTGGEPFLVAGLPAALAVMAEELPTLVLSNGTRFTGRLLDELAPLADLDFAVQVSLDSADPAANDEMRGPRNFASVVRAIPRLRELGIRVRVATTTVGLERDELARLCELHRSLGVPDEDHVVRPIVRRGRAVDHGLGVAATMAELPAELTITADGAFWSPFGPTVHGGRLDTDLLITRTIEPLSVPAEAMLRIARGAGAQTVPEHLKIA